MFFAAPFGDTSLRDAEGTEGEEANAFLHWYAGIEAAYLRVSPPLPFALNKISVDTPRGVALQNSQTVGDKRLPDVLQRWFGGDTELPHGQEAPGVSSASQLETREPITPLRDRSESVYRS